MLTQHEVVGKPRLSYAEFVAQQQKDFTVAQIIERFIRTMNGLDGEPPVRTLGASHLATLHLLQRYPIAIRLASALTKADVIAHCRQRQVEGVKPSTVSQDITFLTGALRYAGSAWDDCPEISDKAVRDAKPFLERHNLTGRSEPRKRLPTPEEHAMLLAHFAIENARRFNKIDMVKVSEWQLKSARRISETCRIEWTEWDRESQTIMVHKMKDPKNRNKSKRVALTDEAQAMLEAMWPLRDPNEPRIFPYNPHSCSARYTLAKKALGIVGLRLHDSRAKCYTSMREKGIPGAVAILVTGHETEALPERVYKRMKAESFKDLQHVRAAA